MSETLKLLDQGVPVCGVPPRGASVLRCTFGLKRCGFGSDDQRLFSPSAYVIGDSHDGQIDVCRLVAMVI